jgi:hypothetical protein
MREETMHRSRVSSCRRLLPALFLAGLAALIAAPAWADTVYRVQPLLKVGDPIGDTPFTASLLFEIDALGDDGELLFVTTPRDDSGEMLFRYAAGAFTPIVLPGGEAPGGKWPARVGIYIPASANRAGSLVFSAIDYARIASQPWLGTFLWDHRTQKVLPIAVKGMAAVEDLTIEVGGGHVPAINNRDEIVFPALLKAASGKVVGYGTLLREPEGRLLPVVLPGQALPGGEQVRDAFPTSLNDAGAVSFLATRVGERRQTANAYLWEKGAITLLAAVDTDAPAGGKIVDFWGAWVNNGNRDVLLGTLQRTLGSGPLALYRHAGGTLTPVAAPGQEMPGGGTFVTVPPPWPAALVSAPNDRGQHAFVARISDGGRTRTALYRMEADGRLSLVLKSGMQTDLGEITSVGVGTGGSLGVALNNKGQIAVTVSTTDVRAMIAVLTPAAE